MKVLGIVAEYDPFHSGHKYHLTESMAQTGAGASVCVMSGHFTQRGYPSMIGRGARARAAAECGIDLVLELPFVYAANNAEYFAMGAVRILNALGVVDVLSFGSESGDIRRLGDIASLFSSGAEAFNASVRDGMTKGKSYPAAIEGAVRAALGDDCARLMRGSNNILAIEYMKQLKLIGSGIEPVTVMRKSAGVAGINADEGIAGATAIRRMFGCGGEIADTVATRGIASEGSGGGNVASGSGVGEGVGAGSGVGAGIDTGSAGLGADTGVIDTATNHAMNPYDFLPEASARIVREYEESAGRFANAGDLFPHLVYSVMMKERGELGEILSATEGLENRLISAVSRAATMDEAVRFTKTRRYTETRVRRLILHTVAGLTKQMMTQATAEPLYARVLAFTDVGAKLIRQIKKNGNLSIITNANREREALKESPVTFLFDQKSAMLYGLLVSGTAEGAHDLTYRPFHV